MAAKRTGPKCRTINGVVYDLTATDRKPPCGRGRPSKPASSAPPARASKPPAAPKPAAPSKPPAKPEPGAWEQGRFARARRSGVVSNDHRVREREEREREHQRREAREAREREERPAPVRPARTVADPAKPRLKASERELLKKIEKANRAGLLYHSGHHSPNVKREIASLAQRGALKEAGPYLFMLPEYEGKGLRTLSGGRGGFAAATPKATTLAAAGKIEAPAKAAELGGTERMILQYVKRENQAGKLYVPRDGNGAVAAVLADLVKRGLVTERPGGRYLLPEFDGQAQFKLAPEPDLYAHLPKETGAAKLRRKQINAVSKLIERSPTALTQGAIVDATGLPVRTVADAIIALTGDKSIKLASPDAHGFPRYEWAHWRRTGVVKLAPLPAPIEPKSASIGQHVSVFSYGEGQPEHATLIELPASKDPVVKFDTGSQRGFQRSIQWARIYPGWLERHGNWKPWRG